MRFVFGNCDLDTERYELRRAGQVVALEPRALRVLAYLLRHAGRAVAKQELVQACWPGAAEAPYTEYALRNCLHKIRQVVGGAGTQRAVIETVRGYGYRWVAAVTTLSTDAFPAGDPPPDQEDDHPAPVSNAPPQALPGRRQLTVLRCALVEEPAYTQLDPEDVRVVLQAFYTAGEAVIQRFNGYIAQYDSAGLLVYFGYPVADEDAAPRAVRAGLALVQAVQRLVLPGKQAPDRTLTIRVGIHTGPVVVEEQTRLAVPALAGATLTLATRAQACAPPATVVLSAATYHLVEGYFRCEPLAEPLPIRDDDGLALYRVLEASDHHTRFEVAATHGLTPFVGREAELALLRERWAQVQDGWGQVIVLSGEPGIGKSRLVQVLKERVAGDTDLQMTWRGLPSDQHSPFAPVLTHLQRALGWEPDEAPGAKLGKLEAALPPHPMGLSVVVPLFAALLSLPLSERYPPLMLTPQRQKQLTLEALLAWLLAETARHPVLLIVEDLHWVDPSTLEFLTLVVEQSPTARLYSLFTCRPEFTPPWRGRAHLTSLTLSRLSRPQVEQMMQTLTSDKVLPVEVLAQLVTTTDGVPLFVEELTRAVLESALLREDAAAYVLNGPPPQVAIPATLQDSLMARLDRLGTTRAVAQLGATLGREFAYAVLQAVAPLGLEALQRGLRQLVEAEILYQRGVPPQTTYVFKHALIQDAAYQSLLARTRQQYHQRIAQVLVERFSDTVQTQPELVAQHYTEAGCPVQAIPYWQRAGQRALERAAILEAISHLTRGMGLLATLPETPTRTQQELALQVALGSALMAAKGPAAAEVEQAYARARELCLEVSNTPEICPVLRGLWQFYLLRGALQTARELAEQLDHLTQEAAGPTSRLAAHEALGTILFSLGEYTAAWTHLEQGIALIDPTEEQAQVFRHSVTPGVGCLAYAANTLWCLGAPTHAAQRSQEGLALAQALANPHSLAFAQHWAAYLSCCRREVAAVQRHTEALLALAAAQQFPYWVEVGIFWRGWVLTMQGQGRAGLAQMHQGLAALLAMGSTLSRTYCLVLLAEAAGRTGQAAEGLRLLTEALAAFETSGQGDLVAEASRLQGVLLLRQAIPDAIQAEVCLHRALTIARRQQAKAWELRAALSLSRLWQRQGRRDEAWELLTPIYGWFTEGFDTADLQEAQALLEELEG